MANVVLRKGERVRILNGPLGGAPVVGRMPRLGETGTIRHVLKGVGILYVVERLAADGSREWLCEFAEGDLEATTPTAERTAVNV
jgi:hypothetical protein